MIWLYFEMITTQLPADISGKLSPNHKQQRQEDVMQSCNEKFNLYKYYNTKKNKKTSWNGQIRAANYLN